MHEASISQYWQRYLQTLTVGRAAGSTFRVDQFGDTPELADELGHLVVIGVKTATCSAPWEWEAEQQHPLVEVGVKTIILDGAKTPHVSS